MDLDLQQILFKTHCKRKHMILNRTYTVYVYTSQLCIGDDKPTSKPKYSLEFTLENRLLWKFSEDARSLRSFGLVFGEKIKWFDGEPAHIQQLKAALGNRIFFGNISLFYDSMTIIGSGASCKVCQIMRKSDQVMFAAKCVSKKYLNSKRSPDRLTRLCQEICILQRLQHTNVVSLLEIYQGENSYYLITELFAGDTLYKYIKNSQSLTESQVKVILKQLLEGVDYLDSQEIIHRDIKLENILFAKQNDIESLRIIDMGLAIYKSQKVKFSICGTPGYIAPEILLVDDKESSNTVYTHKCDMFSVGVILYKMLTRKTLFQGQNTAEILEHNKTCIIDYIEVMNTPTASDEAICLLRMLLCPDPLQRPTAKEALSHPYFSDHKEYKKTMSALQDQRGNFSSFTIMKLHPCTVQEEESDEFGLEEAIQHMPQMNCFLQRKRKRRLQIDIDMSPRRRDHLTIQKSADRASPYMPSFSGGVSLDSLESPVVQNEQFQCGKDFIMEERFNDEFL